MKISRIQCLNENTEIPAIYCHLNKILIYLDCLFVLRINVPVNNFSVMSGLSQHFLGLTSTGGS